MDSDRAQVSDRTVPENSISLKSTVAIMAAHRVTEWNAGVSKLITQDYPSQVPDEWDWTGPSSDI